MAFHYSFLTRDHFPLVYRTFVEAFADYYVDASYVTREVLLNRAIKNGVEFESSVGVFDKKKMVGFTIIGIDVWNDSLSAFDAGTGIIPAYKGKGIAKQMFDFAVPRLREKGVSKFLLEVIQANEPAVRAYRKAGFVITREFDCFELNIESANLYAASKLPLEVKPLGKSGLAEFSEHIDWQPSWENSFASIERIPDRVEIYGAFVEGICGGLLVYYPLINWIMSLVVKREYRRKGIATSLVSHFVKTSPSDVSVVKLINVDHSDEGMLKLLEKLRFKLTVKQYEMECSLR
ncbi:MAG: GNAT family N-acetyltransferase [Candidatus Latescibacteria bacterium]|nr:GNAT family N-acetyltransferase [Candidatus Latescibacterota bacterium]NIO56298.1 GNAT family N-acetyltransferase [Candidatus Latescibacterota bacterium]